MLLYACTYPDQVEAIVFNDAFSPTVPAVFGSLWPAYRDGLLNPPLDIQFSQPDLIVRSTDLVLGRIGD